MPLDNAAELFVTYDEAGVADATVPRAEVHRRGLWHKAAQVLVYYPTGELLMQQRAATKDLYAGLWDYSVGEHLQPGEDFLQAAQRGLIEELGLPTLDLNPIGDVRRQEFLSPDRTWHDRELQQAFVAQYNPDVHGSITPDHTEIARLEWVAPNRFAQWLVEHKNLLVPWFVDDLQALGLLES